MVSTARRALAHTTVFVTLLAGAVVVSPAPAHAAGCSGTLIEHVKMYGNNGGPYGSLFAHLDVYYNSSTGDNCARVNSYGSYWGYSKKMGVEIDKCYQTVESAECDTVAHDDDPHDGAEVQGGATYLYYAGPVSVHAPNNCIFAFGIVIIGNSTAVGTTRRNGHDARHCG